jgi:hypothetical protein
MAFNFGGKPIYVMPLVFGGAPVVNTMTTVAAQGTMGEVSMVFYVCLALVILGATMVLVFAPRKRDTETRERKGAAEDAASTDEPPSADNEPPTVDSSTSSSDGGGRTLDEGETMPDEDGSVKTAADHHNESDEDTYDPEDTHDLGSR